MCLPIFKCPGRHGDHTEHCSLSPCSWHLLGSIVYPIKKTFSSVEHPRVLIANETGPEPGLLWFSDLSEPKYHSGKSALSGSRWVGVPDNSETILTNVVWGSLFLGVKAL